MHSIVRQKLRGMQNIPLGHFHVSWATSEK